MKYFILRISVLSFLLLLVILFQGQLPNRIFNDNNPAIEQPTQESYSHFRAPRLNPDVITINDYDNFDVSIDFYEQNMTTNPNNPLQIFFGVNASSSLNSRNTTNGGLNWSLNNPAYPGGTCCDPWTTYTGSGVLIYGTLHTSQGQHTYRSTDNGLTWSSPVLSASGNDRNHVSAEYTGTGPYANYVYAGLTPGNFGRSTDAGMTWTTIFAPSNSLPGCYIAVGPNGTVNGECVIYVTNTGNDQGRTYNFWRSTNGGASFTLASSQVFANQVGFYNTAGRHTINNARTAPHPKIAMDNSNGPYRGRLYLVYASNDPPGNGNRPDIWLRYSTDQGVTWSSATIVNDNVNPQQSDQWFPEISCERTTGYLYIHWYDDRSNPSTFQTDIYATYTTNGGATFAPNQRLTNQTFTFPSPGCSPNTNCYRGDYTSISANPNAAFSVWSDHRNGNAQNMCSYFPDFALRVNPGSDTLNSINDSSFHYISIPSVKLWTKTTKFTASVSPLPSAGTINLSFLDKITNGLRDSLTTYPDSLRLRVKTSGGVSPWGVYTVTITGNGTNGTPVHRRTVSLLITDLVGSISINEIPNDFQLYQNFPNPFNPQTVIIYSLPVKGFANLIIYDILGKEITTLVKESLEAGTHEVKFDASNYPSGIYFYRLESGDFVDVKKMLLIK